MVAETFTQALRALGRRKPFKPFTVELVSGERIEIEHPEALVFRNAVAVYIRPQGEIALFDHEGVTPYRQSQFRADDLSFRRSLQCTLSGIVPVHNGVIP
jgi:hypothetical protein